MAGTANSVPSRAVLYLRQSVDREESISLELQEHACRQYCQERGYEVTGVEADPGVSGRTWNRPAVQRVMATVENGAADVIVLWKWSRLSRSRRDWAVAADRVETAGGRIESATEPLDVATSSGRFARGVMTELAAFESERIGDGWREAHARRVEAGLPANGKPRWGYSYDHESKRHYPDPVAGPVLASLYRRYVAGESMYSLARWLTREGYRTSGGYSSTGPGLWSDRSLRRVLDSGFGAGLLRVGDRLREGVHEPVISAGEWEAYLVARRSRSVQRSSERSRYLLSGMVRCGVCEGAMTAGQFGSGRVPKFRCKRAKELGVHAGGYASMRVVEAAVLEWLRGVAGEVDDAVGDPAPRTDGGAARLEAEAGRVREQLLRATRGHVAGTIPAEAYEAVRDELQERLQGLEQRIQEQRVLQRRPPAPAAARGLLADWDLLSVEHRRGALRALVDRVVVTPGAPQARVLVVPAWGG